MIKNVLIVELNKYHTETLSMYKELIPFLIGNHVNFSYMVHPKKCDEVKRQLKGTLCLATRVMMFCIYHLQLRRIFFKYIIQKYINKNNIDVVVFNTIEPSRNYKVFKSLNVRKKIGVIHNFGEVDITPENGEKYFVVTDYGYDNLHKRYGFIDGFLLPFYRSIDFEDVPVTKRDYIVISISGHVDFKKRDYNFLLDALSNVESIKELKIKFNIVSSVKGPGDGERLKVRVKDNGLEDFFIFHNNINDDEFYKNVAESDFVMPLVNKMHSQFLNERLTASYSMAMTYEKPMIIESEFAKSWGIEPKACLEYCDRESFLSVLYNLHSNKLCRDNVNVITMKKDKIDKNINMLSEMCL